LAQGKAVAGFPFFIIMAVGERVWIVSWFSQVRGERRRG